MVDKFFNWLYNASVKQILFLAIILACIFGGIPLTIEQYFFIPYCDKCGTEVPYRLNHFRPYNYCPWCGKTLKTINKYECKRRSI